MSGGNESVYDEEAAMEEAHERCAAPPLREVLKREHDERLKGRLRDKARWRNGVRRSRRRSWIISISSMVEPEGRGIAYEI
jgi:hypothetical protein